jgi:iron complex transport system substrate-binding protein
VRPRPGARPAVARSAAAAVPPVAVLAALLLLLAGSARALPAPNLWVDDLGDTLRLAHPPVRIISLSPNLTECLFALGVDSTRIAGVTRFCDTPPAARRRPQVGGIVDPSLEIIQMQRPDLVLAARGNPVEIQRRIRALGFPLYAFDDRGGAADVARILSRLAELTSPEDTVRAGSLMRGFRRKLEAAQKWSAALSSQDRPRVYYADPQYPTFSAGPGSHLDDIIRLAGGTNLITQGGAWPQITPEMLVAEQPDWLLLARPEGWTEARALEALKQLPGWSSLRAIRQGRICWVDASLIQRPGPRILEAVDRVAACLHPQRPQP